MTRRLRELLANTKIGGEVNVNITAAPGIQANADLQPNDGTRMTAQCRAHQREYGLIWAGVKNSAGWRIPMGWPWAQLACFARPTRIPVSDGATRCTNTPCGIFMPICARARVPGQWLCRGRELFAERDALIEALEAYGPGELIHPKYGMLNVVVLGRVSIRSLTPRAASPGLRSCSPRPVRTPFRGRPPALRMGCLMRPTSWDRSRWIALPRWLTSRRRGLGRRPGRPRQLQLGCPAAAGGPERPDRYRRRHRARRLRRSRAVIHPHPHARDAGPSCRLYQQLTQAIKRPKSAIADLRAEYGSHDPTPWTAPVGSASPPQGAGREVNTAAMQEFTRTQVIATQARILTDAIEARSDDGPGRARPGRRGAGGDRSRARGLRPAGADGGRAHCASRRYRSRRGPASRPPAAAVDLTTGAGAADRPAGVPGWFAGTSSRATRCATRSCRRATWRCCADGYGQRNPITLVVGGQAYGGWKSLEVERGIEQLAGEQLTLTHRWPGEDAPIGLREGLPCEVKFARTR